ncbi:cytochrome P450 [Mycena polygramma]|nr:cytochrome P450 [Mycena polygramma]
MNAYRGLQRNTAIKRPNPSPSDTSTMHFLLLPLVLGVATVTYYLLKALKRPPGPPALPLIGNLLQMPKNYEWKTYAQWSKQYGDVVYLEILGQPIVVLHSLTAAHDLLNQRSAIYSSRPRLVMAGELVGFNQIIPLMPYTPRFLTLRRLIRKELAVSGLQKYWPLYEDESRILIDKILLDPDHFLEHIRHYSGSIILRSTYGYQTTPRDDPFLVETEKLVEVFSQAAKPGAWAVDILPWLRHLPSWFPGTGFKRWAAFWHQKNMESGTGIFRWALENQDSPNLIRPNYLSTILAESQEELSDEHADLLLWATASLFGAGADTSVAALSTFYLAMALYPDIQATAQAELDKVLTDGRLPQLSDRASLPYLECLMREVLRWKPLAPIGIPHLSIKDDIYRDYHIPSGSIVMVNVWSILRDPVVFPNPEEFQPTRFLKDDKAVEVASSIFGFGRRACPGVYFAEATMFIAIAMTLYHCNISDPVDIQGNKISRDVDLRPGTISHPEKFRCRITARRTETM